MKKIIKLTESDLELIIRRVIKEQVIQGGPGDNYEYKKEGDYFYARKKGSDKWILTKGEMANAIKTKIFSNTKPSEKMYCEPHPKDSRVNPQLEKNYQPYAIKLGNQGVPKRLACQVSFIKLRPELNKKPFFVIDTKHNLIYLFDGNGNFVAKSFTLDGKNAQSQDAKSIATALMTYNERLNSFGYTYDDKTKQYKDKNGKVLENPEDKFYSIIDQTKSRFFPKGIYSVSYLTSKSDYAGGEDNVFMLQTSDGKKISQAIHGYYKKPERVAALNMLRKQMGKSYDINNPTVSDEFINYVTNYLNNSGINLSYGCINVPVDFINKSKAYAKQNPLVFVIAETDQNYLVQNPTDFFEKMGENENCVNPASLGVNLDTENVA